MKLLLCFTLGLVTFTITNAKNIKIKIDPDDILKLLNGMMSSETVKNFATQLAQRGLSKGMGYNNPYHPEDDLVSTFNDAIDKEKNNYENKLRHKTTPKPKQELDPLDLENELFVDENEVVSEDVLTENEHGKLSVPHEDVHENDTQEKSIKVVNVKSSNPTDTVKLLNATRTSNPVRLLKSGNSENVKLFKPLTNKTTKNKPRNNTFEIDIPLKQILTRKDSRLLYKDDRANFKPVQTRFVLKSSNDGDNDSNFK